jgi:hypothetical protein
MSNTNSNRRRPTGPALGLILALLLASLGLAACGGSSSTTATSANASATAPRGAGATGPGGARFRALRECLQKNGITLPKRTPGQRSPGGGPGRFLGGGVGGPQLPSGVTRAQYEAAIKKCGGGAFANRGARLKNPAYLAALTKFAACLRENGVDVPPPNTSGNGPIFSTKGINTASAQFQTAQTKCRGDLAGAFRRRPEAGATGAAGAPGGAPPGGPGAG